MAHDPQKGESWDQIEALLDRWQTSLDLHARYAALDDARYWHVQPWPKHERPQRWIIQLARKRILALKRLVAQRQAEGDRAFIEGIEIMGFLAGMVGPPSVDRFIPLASAETERRDVMNARPAETPARGTADTARTRAGSASRERESADGRRTADTTRQMPALPDSKVYRMLAAQRAGVPLKSTAATPAATRRRDAARPATARPRKASTTVTQMEHVVIADAVRLLGWGKQWHELAEMIARLAERPAPSEIRRILRTYREQIDAVARRRGE